MRLHEANAGSWDQLVTGKLRRTRWICLLFVAFSLSVLLTPFTQLQPAPATKKLIGKGNYSHISTICHQLSQGVLTAKELSSSTIEACHASYFKPRTEKVNTSESGLLKTGSGVCSNRTFMVVVVMSLHTNVDRRAAIRATWGAAAVSGRWPNSLTRDNKGVMPEVRLAFMFGRLTSVAGAEEALAAENDQYGDIVQANFDDSYRNLTLKSLTCLHWVINYCPSAKFMLKSDDDMFVNIPAIIDVVWSNDLRWSIIGKHCGRSPVHRVGKWALNHTEYPFDYFPAYMSGTSYLVTADLLRPLLNASNFVPHIFLEDVYITGILGRAVGARLVSRGGFSLWSTVLSSSCNVLGGAVLTVHKVTPARQRLIWNDLTTGTCRRKDKHHRKLQFRPRENVNSL